MHAFHIQVGDPKQLPATIISQLAQRCGYGRSAFERLVKNGRTAELLDTQYRMLPGISEWPNQEFYTGKVRIQCMCTGVCTDAYTVHVLLHVRSAVVCL